MDAKVCVSSCMYDQVIGLDDEGPVDDDQVMTDDHACFPRDACAKDGTAVGDVGFCPSGDVNRVETRLLMEEMCLGRGLALHV